MILYLIVLGLPISRQGSATSTSAVSSCPPIPIPCNELLEKNPDSKIQYDDTLPSLKPITSDYRLSHQRLRQLSPVHGNLTTNLPVHMKNTTENFVNHAYVNDASSNQLAIANSITASSISVNSISSLVSATTTMTVPSIASSAWQIFKRKFVQNIKHMCSVIFILMKNPRYICVIVANLFEGILIKGSSYNLFNIVL